MTADTFRLVLAICTVCLTLAIIGAVSPTAILFIVIFGLGAAILWLGYRAIRWVWRHWG